MGMKVKHTVCIDDLVEKAAYAPGDLDIAIIDEKIGDEINLLILLEGLLKTRAQLGASNSWPECEFGSSTKVRDEQKDAGPSMETTISMLQKKDGLLAEALDQLLACEWEVSLSTIVKIQKELEVLNGKLLDGYKRKI